MNAVLFDTLRVVQTLRDKGHFPNEQAEAIAEALGQAAHADLATKDDLDHLATKADLESVRSDILKWVVGAIGFQTVVILGAIVSLIKIFAK